MCLGFLTISVTQQRACYMTQPTTAKLVIYLLVILSSIDERTKTAMKTS